jgi:hypothetical protein
MTKKKIQLVLDEEQQTTLDALRDATHAESMAHVLRDALGVYSALHELLRERGPEAQLAVIDRAKQEFQELNVPSLQGKHVVPGAKAPIGIVSSDRASLAAG